MSIVRIGIRTKCLGVPFKRALELASKFGADGVSIDAQSEIRPADLSETGIRHVRKMLSDSRLGVSAVGLTTRQAFAEGERLEERIAATRAAMKMAYQLGAELVSTSLGPIPDADSPAWQTLIEAMLSLGQYGEHVGARLAAQTTGVDGPTLLGLIDAIPDGTLGADLHPANLIRFGGSPAEAVEALGPHIRHVHACDAVRDFATGTSGEVPLGRGTVDFPALLGNLESYGYRGWATITRQGDQVASDMANAVQFLRNVD